MWGIRTVRQHSNFELNSFRVPLCKDAEDGNLMIASVFFRYP